MCLFPKGNSRGVSLILVNKYLQDKAVHVSWIQIRGSRLYQITHPECRSPSHSSHRHKGSKKKTLIGKARQASVPSSSMISRMRSLTRGSFKGSPVLRQRKSVIGNPQTLWSNKHQFSFRSPTTFSHHDPNQSEPHLRNPAFLFDSLKSFEANLLLPFHA
jgi:hypothetical protein